MRKLNILKAIVDFIWFVTLIPLIIVAIIVAVYMFFDPSIIDLVKFNEMQESAPAWKMQLLIIVAVLLIFGFVYCFYLFRSTLRYFQKAQPFHSNVIFNYNKIGNWLLTLGILSSLVLFLSKLLIESRFVIDVGLSPYLLIICSGLFFKVLSETFKIAKHAKEENELTV